MKIAITNPNEETLKTMGTFGWPIWEKEISQFDWKYDQTEQCYILEGEAVITSKFERTIIKAGDFVEFPKGLECFWDIKKPIRKHYTFK